MSRAVHKLALRRSGGFAGLTQECSLEAEELPTEARTALEGWMAVAAEGTPLSTDSLSTHPACGADLFRYELRVTAEDATTGDPDERTFTFDDETLPEELAPLIDTLCDRLRPVERNGSQAQRK